MSSDSPSDAGHSREGGSADGDRPGLLSVLLASLLWLAATFVVLLLGLLLVWLGSRGGLLWVLPLLLGMVAYLALTRAGFVYRRHD